MLRQFRGTVISEKSPLPRGPFSFFKHKNISIIKEVMDIFCSSCLLVSCGLMMHIMFPCIMLEQVSCHKYPLAGLDYGNLLFLILEQASSVEYYMTGVEYSYPGPDGRQ